MTTMKDYFMAGIMLEEAREKRDAARLVLREAAAKHCPTELALLDAASDVLTAAEKHMAEVMTALMRGDGTVADVQKAMRQHAETCDNPTCPIKVAMSTGQDKGAKLN